MMINALTLFLLGFMWLFGLAVQTITISRKGKMYLETALVVFLLSLVSVLIIKKLAFYENAIDALSYAFGTAFGAIAGKIVTEKYEDKFHQS